MITSQMTSIKKKKNIIDENTKKIVNQFDQNVLRLEEKVSL